MHAAPPPRASSCFNLSRIKRRQRVEKMLPVRLILVRNIRVGGRWCQAKFSSSNKDGGNSEEQGKPKTKETAEAQESTQKQSTTSKSSHQRDKSRAASLKLNELLHSMLKEETSRAVPSKTEAVALSRPKQRKKERKEASASPAASSLGASVVQAAQQVASQLGGDEGQTQAELLGRVAEAVDQGIAASTASPHAPPGAQQSPVVAPTRSPINLSELIVGMKIDRSQPATTDGGGRAQQVRHMLAAQPSREELSSRGDQRSVSASMLRRQPQARHKGEAASRAGLGEGVPLGIFAASPEGDAKPEEGLDTWWQLQQRELALAVTHPPANVFEEMILWTNQGKLWHFPINNEQGLEEESSVPFSEHVFLERHIEEWCPKKGPIRHFMELVCVGLSKNPYLTVQAKKEHIAWYKEYFTSKQALLQEVGAIS